MTTYWEPLPSSDFAERARWRALGDDRYAALRIQLMFVRGNGKVSRLGPVIEEHDVAPGDTITLRRKHERVVTQTESMRAAVRTASNSRVLESLSSKIACEIGAKAPGFSGKVQTQTAVHSELEFTRELERTLAGTTSHTIQETEGREYEVKLDGRGGRRRVQLRRRYWPRRWDVYLHSFDYLELSYRRNWLWRRVRESMKRVDAQVVKWPLVSFIFYEPQPDVVVCYDLVADELENPDAIDLQALVAPMRSTSAPVQESLEAAARIAFPITRAEKRQAATRKRATAIGLAGSRHHVGERRRKGATKKKVGRHAKGAKKQRAMRRARRKKAVRR